MERDDIVCVFCVYIVSVENICEFYKTIFDRNRSIGELLTFGKYLRIGAAIRVASNIQ